jgi:rod shape determining protein RodA
MDGTIRLRRIAAGICVVGLLLIATGWAGIVRGEEITDGAGRLLRQQIVWSVMGLLLAAGLNLFDYRWLSRYAALIYVVVVVALLSVYVFPAVNGAHRWIRLGGVGLQPSEFAKLTFIVALSAYLMHRELSPGIINLLRPLLLAALPMLLILKEPDLGTSLVFLPILSAMLFAAGVRRLDLAQLIAVGLLLLPLLWSQMSHEQRSRVTALWEQNGPRESATPDGFHLDQAKRMFAIGGVFGSVFTAGTDTDDDLPACRVPEPHTDSIFCVIGERFGLVGASFVLLLFTALVGLCLAVAASIDEPFGRLVTVGVAALFAGEVLINTGMLVGLLPITGVSLPLVSYGGSGLIGHLLALGLVISIARHS